MDSEAFRAWRKSLGLSQKDAAHALGLKRRVLQYYEKGERDGEDVAIPLYVRLACYALSAGVRDFHGPDDEGLIVETGKGKKKIKPKPKAKRDPKTTPDREEAKAEGEAAE